jgi:hypothetical protein
MVQFDLDKFSAAFGKGNASILDSLGMSFGIPTCLIDLAEGALSILPSNVLGVINNSIQEGKEWAQTAVADVLENVFGETGIVEFDTDTGKFVLKSASSKFGLDSNSISNNKIFDTIGNIIGAGAELWKIGEGIVDQIEQIADCIGSLSNTMKFSSENSAALVAGTAGEVEAGLADYTVSDLPVGG